MLRPQRKSFVRLSFLSALSHVPVTIPVPESKCGEVVKHAQKVLGAMAPSAGELMSQCKAADDSARGCVMAATKKGALAQCL
ncbi:hypothetical protein P4S70_23585 [Enterovibrio sp. Hal110]